MLNGEHETILSAFYSIALLEAFYFDPSIKTFF